MTDMAVAFGVFANKGMKTNLSAYSSLVCREDRSMNRKQPRKVMDESTAYIISDILSDNFARRMAFGSSAAEYQVQIAVKTNNR